MRRFGEDPRAFFNAVYQDTAPWDVGIPQPALAELIDAFPPADPVLDVGCGSGDLSIALAERGLNVLGVDFAPGAIEQARQRAGGLPPPVSEKVAFQLADVLDPSRLGRRFGAIVDSGFYHLFEPDEIDRFIDGAHGVLVPGGRYYLLAFAKSFDIPHSPRSVGEAELRDRFQPERGWRIEALRPAEFLSRIAPVPAICACIQRLDRGPASARSGVDPALDRGFPASAADL